MTTATLKRDTEVRLLDTAASLFFAHGYHVGIDNIIAKSNVAKMTFYKYFPSKADLITAVIKAAQERVTDSLITLDIADRSTGATAVVRIFDNLMAAMVDQVCMGALVSRALVELQGNKPACHRQAITSARIILSAIQDACSRAGVEDAAIVKQIHLSVSGAVILRPVINHEELTSAAKAALKQCLRQ